MEVTILSQTKTMATLRLTIEGEKLSSALDSAYKTYMDSKPENPFARETITTDPAAQNLFRDTIQEIFSEHYSDAIAQSGLTVASEPMIRVLRADESLGMEFEIEFALRPELKLGQYKGIHVKMPETEPTEEDYAAAIAAAERQNSELKTVDRPTQLGDTATIDFTGYLDGVPFDGGAGNDFPLVLGSGSFIPGFEDQLVGASAGDNVVVNVTFPENYGAENLAGKPAIFRCKIKKVEAPEITPLTDEQKEQVRQQVAQQKRMLADQQVEDQVLEHILAEAECEIPEAMLDSEVNICMDQYVSELQAQGMTFEAFLSRSGLTAEQVVAEMRPLARRRIMLRMVLTAIAEAEQLTATQEEVDKHWEDMAKQYGVEPVRLKVYMGDGADDQIRSEIAASKAYDLLRQSTILDQ